MEVLSKKLSVRRERDWDRDRDQDSMKLLKRQFFQYCQYYVTMAKTQFEPINNGQDCKAFEKLFETFWVLVLVET